MAINLPTQSLNETLSSLKSNALLNTASQVFFGSGTLSGTVKDTALDFTPIKAVVLNPQDFPDLNPSQLASLQQTQNLQVQQVNMQKQQVLNQYNQLRKSTLQRGQDTLATSQLLFSGLGGIQPIFSSSNAAGLTGISAGTRSNLMNDFNQAQNVLGQLDQTGLGLGVNTLNAAIMANREQNAINFGQSTALTDRLGTFVDQRGNLQNIAGATNVRTLAGKGSDMNEVQLADSLTNTFLERNLKQAQNTRANISLDDELITSNLRRDLLLSEETRNQNAEGRIQEMFPIDLNAALLQNQQRIQSLQQANEQITQSREMISQAGIYAQRDAKGNFGMDVGKIAKYGTSVSDIAKLNNVLLAQGNTGSVNPALDNLKQLYASTGGANVTKKIWFETPTDKKNSFVAYQINSNGKPAGYRIYNVPNPDEKVKYTAYAKDGSPVQLEQTISQALSEMPLNDQLVNDFLTTLEKDGKAKVLDPKGFVENLAKSTPDPDLKQFIISGVVGQQLNSSFSDLVQSDPKAGQQLAQDFVKAFSEGGKWKANEEILNADGNTNQISASKFNFNNKDLSKEDAAYADTLREMLSLRDELKNNLGDEGKAKEYFKYMVGAFLGSADAPEVKLAENIFSIKLNP